MALPIDPAPLPMAAVETNPQLKTIYGFGVLSPWSER
jgi:hypothetical protein